MEKLIKLLNEYEKDGVNEFETYVERWYCERTYQILSGKWENSNELKPCEIISKRYGFIKWLVENDKIDRDNAKLRKSLWETDTSDIDKIIYTIKNSDYHYVMREAPYDSEESLLMLLSIQDEPINFLISILK